MGSVGESSKGNRRGRRGITSGAVFAGAALLATACASGAAAPSADRSPDGRMGTAPPTASATSDPTSSPNVREFRPTAAQRREFGPTFTLVLQDIGAIGMQASRLPESVMRRSIPMNGRVGRQWDFASDGQEMAVTVLTTTSGDGKVFEDVYTSTSNQEVQRTGGGPELPADDEFSFSEGSTGAPNEVYVKLSGQGTDTEFSVKPGEEVSAAQREAIRIANAAMTAVANQALNPLPG